MEPWKLAIIGVLGAGMLGYGMYANSTPKVNLAPPMPGAAPVPVQYVGKALPAWPSVTQWMNTSAPPSLNGLKGKTVLLEVFRTECSHCQAAAPFLAKLYPRYAPRGIEFVGIQSPSKSPEPDNPEEDWTKVQAWAKAKGYTWPVGFDDKSQWFQGKFGQGVSYPSLFLLGPDGKVGFFQSGHTPEKALDLAVELEKVAPGQGDNAARARDLTRFLASDLGVQSDQKAQQSLAADIQTRLSAKPQTKTAAAPAPAKAG